MDIVMASIILNLESLKFNSNVKDVLELTNLEL